MTFLKRKGRKTCNRLFLAWVWVLEMNWKLQLHPKTSNPDITHCFEATMELAQAGSYVDRTLSVPHSVQTGLVPSCVSYQFLNYILSWFCWKWKSMQIQQCRHRMYYASKCASESRSPAGNALLRLGKGSTGYVWLLFPMTCYPKVSKEGKYCFCFTSGENKAENGELP